MASWWNGKLANWQVDIGASRLNGMLTKFQMGSWKNEKWGSWKNGKLITCHSSKWQVGKMAKMASWQNGKLTTCHTKNWQADKTASWQNGELSKGQIVKLLCLQNNKWQIDKTASWQYAKLVKGHSTCNLFNLLFRLSVDLRELPKETTHNLWRDVEDGDGRINFLVTTL